MSTMYPWGQLVILMMVPLTRVSVVTWLFWQVMHMDGFLMAWATWLCDGHGSWLHTWCDLGKIGNFGHFSAKIHVQVLMLGFWLWCSVWKWCVRHAQNVIFLWVPLTRVLVVTWLFWQAMHMDGFLMAWATWLCDGNGSWLHTWCDLGKIGIFGHFSAKISCGGLDDGIWALM